MVDYSKWRNIQDSDSDENDVKPSVTTLTQGEKITIGPSGVMIATAEKESEQVKTIKINPYNNETSSYCWGQSRSEIFVKIPMTLDLKASSIRVTITQKQINISSPPHIILEGELRYDIENSEDYIDWELVSMDRVKYMTINLQKKCYIPGSVVWWDCLIVGDETIDVAAIPQRQSNSSIQAYNNVWNEAHEAFKKKVQTIEKIDVDRTA